MWRFLLWKLAHTVVVLVLVSLLTTLMLDLAPGDPARSILGETATDESLAQVRADLGLDKAFYERYLTWLGDVSTGDLGTSFKSGKDVRGLIVEALPVTAEIVLLTMLVALLAAVPLGIAGAYRPGGVVDRMTSLFSSVCVSVPPFVSVPLLVWALVLQAGLLPATGWVPLEQDPVENLRHLVLPTIALALVEIPVLAAALRSDMASTLEQDFILSARARGLTPRRVLLGHALRPSTSSLLTLAGVNLGRLIGGAVIVEHLFVLPGIGSLTLDAITGKDIPVVQGIVMFVAVVYVAVNALVDVSYGLVDPRIRAQVA